MTLTRRAVLFGSVALACGLTTTSCGPFGLPRSRSTDGSDFLSAEEATVALRDLVKSFGRETFQLVTVGGYGQLRAGMLAADGGNPSGFDPTTAVGRKATIADEANVDGTVWDWEYRRPPQGGEPLVSYGIGANGPSTRVWLDRSGKVTAVVANENCKPASSFCPN